MSTAAADVARTALIEGVLAELGALRDEMIRDAAHRETELAAVHPSHRGSALNLLHYLTLRRRDLRALQRRLSALGLSSLGRSESNVMASVEAVLGVLHRLASRPPPAPAEAPVDFDEGQKLLARHTDALLGPPTPGRPVRIMVTMPTESAQDYALVRDLLREGMNCMRINCAHDDRATWSAMIDNLRRAEREIGVRCRIVMDLAGPKLRTGPLEPKPAVVRIKPRRDEFGRVLGPARVWLTPDDAPRAAPSPADASLLLPQAWLASLRGGDQVEALDARAARRTFAIVAASPDGCWAETAKTAYVVPGTRFRLEREHEAAAEAPVGPLPPRAGALVLHAGDRLTITRDSAPGREAVHDAAGALLTPARIGCTIPEALDRVQPGEPIWFDDGKIGGVIEAVERDRVLARITHADAAGAKLRADKGINLPDSDVRLAAMTPRDVEDLAFAAQHADIVELSFANTVRDVEELEQRLTALTDRPPAIVLKVETRRGFERLPDMLLAAMRWASCGVMIARGDLAVECGFERLAEVQEEILWICEAGHIPVIWATQVLETLAQRGVASRAEITDAAMGHRAECVMLNKGPHVRSALRMLDDILRRMQAHQVKKRAMLRELRLAHVHTEMSVSERTGGRP